MEKERDWMEQFKADLEEINREDLETEMNRQTRFWFEERFPDEWTQSELFEDAMNMLEVPPFDLFIPRREVKRNPPALVAWIVDEMGRRYVEAKTEYTQYREAFLSRLGPEMDI